MSAEKRKILRITAADFDFPFSQAAGTGSLRQLADLMMRFSPPDPAEVANLASELHGCPCPGCGRPGANDVRPIHRIYSAVAFTSHGHERKICCPNCARFACAKRFLQAAFLGWWGFPWGLVLTPWYLVRLGWGMAVQPESPMVSARMEMFALEVLCRQRLNISDNPSDWDRASLESMMDSFRSLHQSRS
jgi:hypothetical protein